MTADLKALDRARQVRNGTTRLSRSSISPARRIFVAGHRGMVGAALVRRLAAEDCELFVAPREAVDLAAEPGRGLARRGTAAGDLPGRRQGRRHPGQ